MERNTAESRKSFRKAIRLAEVSEEPTCLADAYQHASRAYDQTGNETEKSYLHSALDIVNRTRDTMRIARFSNNLYSLYSRQGKPDSARIHLNRAADLVEIMGDTYSLVLMMLNLGVENAKAGKYEAALRFFLRGETAARQINDPGLLTSALRYIGMLFGQQKRHDQTIKYATGALDIASAMNDSSAISRLHESIGMAHYWTGRYDSALYHCHRAVDMVRRVGGWQLSRRLSNLGYVLYRTGQPDSARSAFAEAVAIGRTTSDVPTLCNALAGYGRVLSVLGQHNDARAAVDEAYEYARELRNPDDISSAVESLEIVCEQQGDFKGAYEAHLTVTAIRDSMLQEENRRTINEMGAKYEADQREKQISLLEKDKKLKDLTLVQQTEQLRVRTLEALKRKQQIGLLEKDKEIQSLELLRHQADYSRQAAVTEQRENEVRLLTKDKQLQASLLDRETFRRNAFLGGLLALLIVTGLIFYRLRERKKANTRLSNTLSELRRTQDQLIHSEKMATLGELTAGIAHEIKNPLNFVTNFSNLSGEMVDELEIQVRNLPSTEVDAQNGNGDPEVLSILDDLKANMGKI
ncbi:MAG: hypothetical protein C0600_05730, partial [Ignavibacteria bacterium]